MSRITPEDTARALVERYSRREQEHESRKKGLREQVMRVVPAIAAGTGARRVYLFGSLVWGRPHARTDIDLAVEGIPPAHMADFAAEALMQLDADVDVVPLERASENLRSRILEEGELIWEAKDVSA